MDEPKSVVSVQLVAVSDYQCELIFKQWCDLWNDTRHRNGFATIRIVSAAEV